MAGNARKVNKEFHSAFATISITVLSIMLAFYGIMVITLAQQAQVNKENAQAYNQKAQASKEDAIGYMRQTDYGIRTFAYTTQPRLGSTSNWSISMEQDHNVRMILSSYVKVNMSFSAISSSTVNSLLGNYSEAVREDEAVREWLNSLNITRFKASYNLAEFSLHELTDMLYTQFPSPPAELNESSALIFIDADFSHPTSFLNWLQQYKVFYDDVSGVHSRINNSIEGIGQAYSDGAKLLSEELDQLKEENSTDSWTIQSLGEAMAYYKAMSTYYPSVLRPLDIIFSSGTSAEVCINQYGSYLNQSESYDQQYYAIRSLAFSGILPPVVLMAFGVAVPLILLGQANRFEQKLDIRKWRYIYNITIVFSISFFVIGTIWGSYVIWAQIYSIFP